MTNIVKIGKFNNDSTNSDKSRIKGIKNLKDLEKYCYDNFIEISTIAKELKITYRECYVRILDLKNKDLNPIRNAILCGEAKRKEDEQKNYDLYRRNFILEQAIIKRNKDGKEEPFFISAGIMKLAESHFYKYLERFEKSSFTRRLDRRLNIEIDNRTTEDTYYLLQSQFLKEADLRAGIATRPQGDRTFREEHLKIDYKSQIKQTEFKSKVLWTPQHDPLKTPKKIITL